MKNHWAYCPDRNGVCAIVIENAERAERDAKRIAELGADIETLRAHVASESKRIAELGWSRIEELSADLHRARAEIDRINAECNAWSNRAKIAEADLDLTRRNMQREINDLERENASLRRRLREGGR